MRSPGSDREGLSLRVAGGGDRLALHDLQTIGRR
jgi:chemotaxis receptor (MCP) glutamine deamidase CheD